MESLPAGLGFRVEMSLFFPNAMPDHDSGYKLLFSHASLVADLLRGFVHEPWVEGLDLSTLEKVNSSYVTDCWSMSASSIRISSGRG